MNAKILGMIAILMYNVRICQSKNYSNFTLYSTTPTEADHLKFLQNLDKQKYIDMVFWKKPYKLYEDVQFIVSPADKDMFLERANHFKLKTEVMLPDVERAFKDQEVRKYLRLKTETFTWDYYHTLEDIYQWLADIAVKYPHIVELQSIGKSAEGREIYAMCIRKRGNKYKVIVESGIHGNEWIAVEFVTYLLDQLVVQNDTKHWRMHELGKKYDWYIIPIINPDGYVYSQTVDRLWRRNRRVTNTGIGVDLNRNFDYNFGKYGTSHDPKDDYFCGSHPFSEPETRVLADFITDKKHNLRFYFSFHAYGQKVIIPFADRIKHIENYGEMENFGKQAILKIYKMFGTKYSVGTTYDTLGLRISGNSASWVKKTHGVRYVFTFLLRDNGTYGYALPPAQILPTCEESIAGLTELMIAKPRRVRLNLFNGAQTLRGTVLSLFCTVNFILLLLLKSTKMHPNIGFFIMFTFYINYCDCRKYYNYTLYRGIPVEDAHLKFFMNLTKMYDVNFWREPGLLYKPVDFVVSPEVKPVFLKEANNLGLYLTTMIVDVQKAFDMQTVKTYIRRKMDSFDWYSYYRTEDIYQWLRDLAKAHPSEMELHSIGRTYENRDIMSVRIQLKGSKNRSRVIVEGGIHAREWIAPAFVTYFIHQIIKAPSSNNMVLKEIALTYEWFFVPILNPDGYEYSHGEDRMWRKNRHDGRFGVDLNRNFDHAFGTVGVKFNKQSEIYCGPYAFSERESNSMANFIMSKREALEYYFAFHSYGQYMIIPYANNKYHEDNFDEVRNMCNDAKTKIAQRFNTQYTVGTAYDTVGYVTSGVSGCWVKRRLRVPYVVTFELRDSGFHGFALPPNKILPTCQETMDGVLSLLSPRRDKFTELRITDSARPAFVMDKIVIFFNTFLFIIVWFD
nr:uncharacterized protein LOC110378813 [Helicoverpa armigera]